MVSVGEALLGVAFQALLDAILAQRRKHILFKKTWRQLETTVMSLRPIVKEIVPLEGVADDAFRLFLEELNKAKLILDIYAGLRKRDLLQRRRIKKQIREFDEYLQLFLRTDLQALQIQMLSHTYAKMVELDAKMDKTIRSLPGNVIAEAVKDVDPKRNVILLDGNSNRSSEHSNESSYDTSYSSDDSWLV